MGDELRLLTLLLSGVEGEEVTVLLSGEEDATDIGEEPLLLATRGSDMTRPLVLPASAAVERELVLPLLVSQVAAPPWPLVSTSTSSSVEESVARTREVIMYASGVPLVAEVTVRAMAAWMVGLVRGLKPTLQMFYRT